jgi:hypothetical protein
MKSALAGSHFVDCFKVPSRFSFSKPILRNQAVVPIRPARLAENRGTGGAHGLTASAFEDAAAGLIVVVGVKEVRPNHVPSLATPSRRVLSRLCVNPGLNGAPTPNGFESAGFLPKHVKGSLGPLQMTAATDTASEYRNPLIPHSPVALFPLHMGAMARRKLPRP